MNAPVLAAPGSAWCTFRLAGRDYGVELARVQEVLRPQPVTRLPLSPPAIAGLINLRGRIVPVVDPLRVLGGGRGSGAGFVVVSSADGPVALLVDAIGDVRRADPDSPPPSLPASSGWAPGAAGSAGSVADEAPPVACTLALPGQLLVVLDLDRVLERAFTPPGSSPRPRPRSDGTRS